ncbi:hypothetical protein KY313_02130 [Candidatus Woesearchaeota archaeon]|jgi:hypothetical protein|nr:hypothetical protein [Candidatus Woesearchaeota archaeon]
MNKIKKKLLTGLTAASLMLSGCADKQPNEQYQNLTENIKSTVGYLNIDPNDAMARADKIQEYAMFEKDGVNNFYGWDGVAEKLLNTIAIYDWVSENTKEFSLKQKALSKSSKVYLDPIFQTFGGEHELEVGEYLIQIEKHYGGEAGNGKIYGGSTKISVYKNIADAFHKHIVTKIIPTNDKNFNLDEILKEIN